MLPQCGGWRRVTEAPSLRWWSQAAWARGLPIRSQDEQNAMSIALYQMRLYWDGRQGAARNGNDTRILVEPPLLQGAVNAEQLQLPHTHPWPFAGCHEQRHDRGA